MTLERAIDSLLKLDRDTWKCQTVMTKTLQSDETKPSVSPDNISDEELLVRFRDKADVDSFEQLVHRYEKPIYTYLARYLRNAALAEDVFQATFLRVFEKSHLFTDGRRVRPWLYSIATHQAIDVLRKEGRHPSLSLDEEHTLNHDDVGTLLKLVKSREPSGFEKLEEHERATWTRAAVDELPDHLRVFILLIYFQGLSYREAAEAFDMPIGTVKTRVHKALIKLNVAWRRDHPDE